MPPIVIDLLCLAGTAGLFAYYFVAFAGRLRRHPDRILQGLNSMARARWAHWVVGDSARAITAVQTLRNGIMAATFFASVSMLLVLGALNLISGAPRATAVAWNQLNFVGSHSAQVQSFKSLALVAVFAVAFFSFALSVRLLVHAGYHVLPAPGGAEPSAQRLAYLVDRSALHYTYGMRAYWAAVPLVFWLFDPLLMVLTAGLVVALLFRLDRTGSELPRDLSAPH